MNEPSPSTIDIAIIGAGPAGLTTAILAKRQQPDLSVVILDGAKEIGAKLLMTGGRRCNLTNTIVRPTDFNGGSRNTIKRILAAFTVEQTVELFNDLGVNVREEPGRKLFPTTGGARAVLNALLTELGRRSVTVRTRHRVHAVTAVDAGFEIATNAGPLIATHVVLATGGMSYPATGSDGGGYQLARALGHTVVGPEPALVPLVLSGSMHQKLSGISLEAVLTVHAAGSKPIRIQDSMLWTHFGISGPVVLNASRHWRCAKTVSKDVTVTANFMPGDTFESLEAELLALARAQPATSVSKIISGWLPYRMTIVILGMLAIEPDRPLAHLPREMRRKLVNALINWPLPVTDTRGYHHAEVTAGGIPLTEIDPKTMASRIRPGLYLVGEILDVDGQVGGFNLQWAWSTAAVAAKALASTSS